MRTHAWAVALAAMALVPLVSAAWEAPEGQPYEVEKRTLDDHSVRRSELSFGPGILAWFEQDWNQAPDPDQGGYLRIMEFEPDNPNAPPRYTEPGGATIHVSVGDRFVVWQLADSTVQAYDRQMMEQRFLGMATTRPHVNGEFVAWADTGSFADAGWRLLRTNLTQIFGTGPYNTTASAGWSSPFQPCPQEAWPSGPWLVVRIEQCVDAPPLPPGAPPDPNWGTHGIVLFDPVTPAIVPVTQDRVVDWRVDADRIIWVAYHESQGRGTNLYLYEISTGLQRRLTWSQGRETSPSLSGDLVVWADLRSERTPMPLYDLYFQRLLTFNEYKIEDTWGFTAGPAHYGNHLAYADEQGHLVLAKLPASEELLRIRVAVDATGSQAQEMMLGLQSDSKIRAAWDLDLDGTFETPSPVRVPMGEQSGSRVGVQAQAVDEAGRVSVVGFEYAEAAAFASTKAGPALFVSAAVSSPDSREGWPIPHVAAAVTLGLLAALIIAMRSRERSR